MSQENEAERIKDVCKEALRKAIPSEEERRETILFSSAMVEKLKIQLRESGFEAEVQVQGSIAKDTWLAGEKDVDIFILLPRTCARNDFQKVLNVVKSMAGGNWLEAYAEHPYVEARMDGYTIDFVPSFKIEKAEEAKSSVDRTPLHTEYVRKHLDQKTRDEVRLVKRFMHGTGTYGAEIRVGGFSGYLCEVLTLHYGSFHETLLAASNWRRKEVIDIEGYYEGEEEEASKIFEDDLIVVDPVDRGRNVASAVKESKLNEFIAAARWFLEDPDLRFFYPDEVKPLSVHELSQTIRQRGSALVFLKLRTPRVVPDVLWGQLYRSQKALRTLIERYDFDFIRDGIWSDEESENIFLFELNSRFLSSVKRHLGPPLEKREDCERFLRKHIGSEKTVSGPYVDGDRWIIETRRTYTDIVSLLKDRLKDAGRKMGIANLISEALANHFEVLVNEEIVDFYQSNSGFAKFLTEYLNGRLPWLQ